MTSSSPAARTSFSANLFEVNVTDVGAVDAGLQGQDLRPRGYA